MSKSINTTTTSPCTSGLSGYAPHRTALDTFIDDFPVLPSATDDAQTKDPQLGRFSSAYNDIYSTSNLNQRLLDHLTGEPTESHLLGFHRDELEECNRNFINNPFNLSFTKALASSKQRASRALSHAQGKSAIPGGELEESISMRATALHRTAKRLVQQWDTLYQGGFLDQADVSKLSLPIIDDWEPGVLLDSAFDAKGNRWEYITHNQAGEADSDDDNGFDEPSDRDCDGLIQGTDTRRFLPMRFKNAFEESVRKVSTQASTALKNAHKKYNWTYGEVDGGCNPTDSDNEANEKTKQLKDVDDSTASEPYLSEKGEKSGW